MVRQANVYHSEGSLENAYVLYLKFMTLFLERIRKHPEFRSVPIEVKTRNQAKLREVLPIAEKLKQELLKQYTEDYNKYVAEIVSRSILFLFITLLRNNIHYLETTTSRKEENSKTCSTKS